jgi:hypothetical protein
MLQHIGNALGISMGTDSGISQRPLLRLKMAKMARNTNRRPYRSESCARNGWRTALQPEPPC